MLGIAMLLGACGERQPSNDDFDIPTYEVPVSPSPSPTPMQPVLPPAPSHRYIDRIGDNYFYQAALSDEEREKGLAVGGLSSFQYLGRNAEGEHVLASMSENGRIVHRSKCKPGCRIIINNYGSTTAFSPETIIGSAFLDAFEGKLRVARWVANGDLVGFDVYYPTPEPVAPDNSSSAANMKPEATMQVEPEPSTNESIEPDSP